MTARIMGNGHARRRASTDTPPTSRNTGSTYAWFPRMLARINPPKGKRRYLATPSFFRTRVSCPDDDAGTASPGKVTPVSSSIVKGSAVLADMVDSDLDVLDAPP